MNLAPRNRTRPLAAGLLVLLTLGAGARGVSAAAQFFEPPDVPYENLPYNGRFTFARIRFHPSAWGAGPHAWGLDLKWNHDYPRADRHLEEILDEVTALDTNTEGGNIIALDDPELFRYPWAYLCEVGYLTLTDEEADNLRNYLLKGGFVVVDDFDGRAWYHFVNQMKRVLPEAEWIEIDPTHPIFRSFFDIDDVHFTSQFTGVGRQMIYGWLRYLAIFEDNDPSKRIMMIANYNNDIGEFWEWSDSPYVSIDLSNEAYKLGINYVIYSMTH